MVLRRLGWGDDEAETAEVPLKLGKDPTESFLKPKKVFGIRVESPSYGWLRQEGSGLPDLRSEGQASSRGSYQLTSTKRLCATGTGSGNSSL